REARAGERQEPPEVRAATPASTAAFAPEAVRAVRQDDVEASPQARQVLLRRLPGEGASSGDARRSNMTGRITTTPALLRQLRSLRLMISTSRRIALCRVLARQSTPGKPRRKAVLWSSTRIQLCPQNPTSAR